MDAMETLMPLELVPDPGYARLVGREVRRPVSDAIVEATMRDRALILATMNRTTVTVNGRPVFPLAIMVRVSAEGWLFWARHAVRLGLTAFLPWWAQVGVRVVIAVERAAARAREVLR